LRLANILKEFRYANLDEKLKKLNTQSMKAYGNGNGGTSEYIKKLEGDMLKIKKSARV